MYFHQDFYYLSSMFQFRILKDENSEFSLKRVLWKACQMELEHSCLLKQKNFVLS